MSLQYFKSLSALATTLSFMEESAHKSESGFRHRIYSLDYLITSVLRLAKLPKRKRDLQMYMKQRLIAHVESYSDFFLILVSLLIG